METGISTISINKEPTEEEDENEIERHETPQSLVTLCFRYIEQNLNDITTSFDTLPVSLLQNLIEFLMQERKLGSRILDENNVHRLFVPSLSHLDLESFWLSALPFSKMRLSPYLKYINLNGCLGIGDEAVISISSNCPNLSALLLDGCNGITDEGVSAICNGCPQLETLHLSANLVSESGITNICTNPKNLRSILLSRVISFPPSVITSIGSMEHLISFALMMKNITFVDFSSMSTGFSSLSSLELKFVNFDSIPSHILSRLQSLKFEKCGMRRIDFIKDCSQLSILKLIRCEKIDDASPIQHIVGNLEELSLFECKKISNDSMKTVFSSISPKMQSLNIGGCRNISKTSFHLPDHSEIKQLNIAWCSLPQPKLNCVTELDLEGLSEMRSDDLKTAIKCCHNLQILNLAECLKLKDNALDILNTGFPYLRSLNLTKCIKLSKPSIHIPSLTSLYLNWTPIVECNIVCPNLTTLDISGAANISEESLIRSLKRSGFHLKNFWAIMTNITDKTLRMLTLYSKGVNVVNMSRNQMITQDGVRDLLTGCRRLRKLYLIGCTSAEIAKEEQIAYGNKIVYK